MITRSRPHAWAVWSAAVLAFFLLASAWALADPLLSGPDEPAHLIRAEAIVRGQLIGTPISANAGNPNTIVKVPGFLERSGSLAYWCFIFHPEVTAVCAPPLQGPRQPIPLTTYVGHYPPLYYLLVGWPSLLDDGTTGVLWMRLASALLNALLLGTALWLAVRRSRVLVVAVLVAATPTVVYYAASVNPNGLEMSSALCFWCALLGLTMPWPQAGMKGAGGGASRTEVGVAAISGCLLALSRGLSPAWAVLAVIAGVAGGDPVRLRLLARRREVCMAAGVFLLVLGASVAWVAGEHGLDELGFPSRSSYLSLFHQTLQATPHYLSEMVGFFGANNVPAPPFATTTIVLGLAVLVVGAFVVGSWRERIVLALLLFAILAVPVASGVATGHHYGLIWQGRYTMAIGVGSPLFAGYVLGAWFERRRVERQVMTGRRVRAASWVAGACVVLALALSAAQFTSFLWNLRRFMVGSNGAFSGVFGGIWQPPVDGFVLLVLAACGSVVLGLLSLRAPGVSRRTGAGRRAGVVETAGVGT